MMTAEELRPLTGQGAGIALVELFGYQIDPIEIDVEEWRRCGLDLGLNGASRVWSVCRLGRAEWIVVESTDERTDPSTIIDRLRHHNRIKIFIVLFHNLISGRFTLLSSASPRPGDRLDIDPKRPRKDVLERISLLGWRPGDSVEKDVTRRIHALFDRGSLSRQFVDRFSAAAEKIADELHRRSPSEASASVADEALLILTRVLFLTFLQERGWLAGDRRYLRHRTAAARASGAGSWTSVLAPLFFDCLNTPIDRRNRRALDLGEIPYLNGGLFERSPFETRNPTVTISDELIRDVLEDMFERFAFSFREDDEKGVHIDPEMLGKVFESLMERMERAKTGTFYTPREIVDRMVEQAISTRLGEGGPNEAALLRKVIRGDSCAIDARIARELIERLARLRILDPACGSGAFLLSALRVIERLWRLLAGIIDERVEPDLRQKIVERSLFGVDIKPEAVRLCELRLWLAIVSDPHRRDTENWRDVPPLPNLDRNILQGHSLLGPLDYLGDGRLDTYRDWSVGLRAKSRMEERYRHAGPDEKPSLAHALRDSDRQLAKDLLERTIDRDCEELRRLERGDSPLFEGVSRSQTRRLEQSLRDRVSRSEVKLREVERGEMGFFSWDVHFAHVLGDGGFDVVVGNPPWVRRCHIDPPMRTMLVERYETFGTSGGFDQSDLAVAFVEKSVSLAGQRGVISLLLPSKILTADYGTRLRRWLATRHRVLGVEDWTTSRRRRFAADTFPISLCIGKSGEKASSAPLDIGWSSDPGEPWILAPPPVIEIMRRLRAHFAPLTSVLGRRPLMGVKTGANRLFFLDVAGLEGETVQLSDGLAIPASAVCRSVRGRDVRRWNASDSTWMLWPPARGWREVPPWAVEFARRKGLDAGRLRLSYVKPEHLGIKVAWKDVSRGLQAVVLPERAVAAGRSFPLVPNQTLYSLDATSLDEAYVLSAILNSTVMNALVTGVAEQAKDSHYRYFGRLLASAPFPEIEPDTVPWSRLSRLARRAHQGCEVQREIDAVVGGLFGLGSADHLHLERFLRIRLSE